MKAFVRFPVFAAFGGATLVASLASAHVRLVYPTPRYPTPAMMNSSADIKTGPCGRANDSRTTDMSRITVLEPGATITVQFNETIDHPGFYRISFDDDGQDAFVAPSMRSQVQMGPTFTLPVLRDNIADHAAGAYTAMVTLPNVECERCTLQLIQVMVNASVMSWDPSPDQDIYYTCADIALRRTGGMGGMGGMGPTAGAGGLAGGSGGAGGTSVAGSGGLGGAGGAAPGTGGTATGGTAAGGVATGGTATGGTATGGTATTGGGGGAPATGGTPSGGGSPAGGTTAGTSSDDGASDEDGGCRMAPAPKGGRAFFAAALAALAIAVRRRRESRSSSA